MKPKADSWNDATAESSLRERGDGGERGVRKSLTRAGLGQLSHVVSGALSSLQGGGSGSNARVSAQNRMKALLNQDRALLSHRPLGAASLMDEPESAPSIPRKGSQTRGAAQNRMRELLNQDRAMLAFRAREGLDADEDLDEVLSVALSEVPPDDAAADAASSTLTSSRMSCVGVTTSFAPEASVSAVCTPGSWGNGPVDAPPSVNTAVTPEPPVVAAAPAVQVVPSVAVAPAPVVTAAPVIKPEPRGEESASDPIRTRGMAKLLALQGYRDRALSIYDELLAVEPNNVELRAEADKLRGN